MSITIPGRATIYRGIRMRSRLEARAAQTLDFADLEWEYEPSCYADATGQYLPDFRIPPNVFMEVKPQNIFNDGQAIARVQRRMQIIRSSQRAGLVIYSPELNEAYVSHSWEPDEWYHQGPWDAASSISISSADC